MTVNNLDSCMRQNYNNVPKLFSISELSGGIDYRDTSIVKACKACHKRLLKNPNIHSTSSQRLTDVDTTNHYVATLHHLLLITRPQMKPCQRKHIKPLINSLQLFTVHIIQRACVYMHMRKHTVVKLYVYLQTNLIFTRLCLFLY